MNPLVPDPAALPITEASQVGDARRHVVRLAQALGFDADAQSGAALVATELATNLARHAVGGELLLRAAALPAGAGIELLAIDRGPGIANLAEALRDGFSTGRGTPGIGLGAVRRLAAGFDLLSAAAGTVIVARLVPASGAAAPLPGLPGLPIPSVGVVCVPQPGETACGDAWALAEPDPNRCLLLLTDGLGHGVLAAAASHQAVKLFHAHAHQGGVAIVEALHAGLRGTRGAAVAVLELRRREAELRFTGVGNIAAAVVSDAGGDVRVRHMVSHNGTAGAEVRRVQEFTYPWPAGAVLLAHTDGLANPWPHSSAAAAGLWRRDPALIAGALYRDFCRRRDDATVVVYRDPA